MESSLIHLAAKAVHSLCQHMNAQHYYAVHLLAFISYAFLKKKIHPSIHVSLVSSHARTAHVYDRPSESFLCKTPTISTSTTRLKC